MIRRLLLALCVACCTIGLLAQGEKPTALDAYTRTLRQLGACEVKLAELGSLRSLQADAIEQRIFDAAGAKQRLEAANPEYALDPITFKISLKSKK